MKKLEIDKLISQLNLDFKKRISSEMDIFEKKDKSLVTEIDYSFSNIVKSWCEENDLKVNFYSEEDHGELSYPACILDPIDGTKELVKGIPECCVSMALTQEASLGHGENFALIYNPFTGFLTTSLDKSALGNESSHQGKLLCFVSRTEYEGDYYNKIDKNKVDIVPKGSIALKLGFLANSVCDAVVSLKPKNVWDIAAGTILCEQRNISFYEQGKKVEKLDKEKFLPPLIWTRSKNFEKVESFLDS